MKKLFDRSGPRKKRYPQELTDEQLRELSKSEQISFAVGKALGNNIRLIEFFYACLQTNWNTKDAYKLLHPETTDKAAYVEGWEFMQRLKKCNLGLVMEAYGMGISKYLDKLKEGLDATRMEAIGNGLYEERPDYKVRRSYHKAQGELLGLEGKKVEETNVNNGIQIQIVKYDDKDPA